MNILKGLVEYINKFSCSSFKQCRYILKRNIPEKLTTTMMFLYFCNLFLCTIIPFVSVIYKFLPLYSYPEGWVYKNNLFWFCFCGFLFVNAYKICLIYNNTLLHSTCTVALLKLGFQYIYIATGDRTNNVNSSFDKHYTISRKKLTWYHGEVIGQQFQKNQWIRMSSVDHFEMTNSSKFPGISDLFDPNRSPS